MNFYFSGTGNSMYIAEQLDTQSESIPQVMKSGKRVFQDRIIGLVCPIYGHEMPQMVKQFLKEAEFKTDYFYIILTYGRRHANAVELAKNYAESIGIKPAYIATLLMVDNFLPAFDMAQEVTLEKHVDRQLETIRKEIQSGCRKIEAVTEQDRAGHAEFLQNMKNLHAQAPYETYWGQFEVTDACIGCGICSKICPTGCISIIDQHAVHEKDGCQACYACIHSCPQTAIHLKIGEANPDARYRNEHISLSQLIKANHQK